MTNEFSLSYINQLRNTLGKVDQSLSYIDESIIWVDGNGCIEWCNHVFAKLTDKLRAELLGKAIDDVITLKNNGETVLLRDFIKPSAEKQSYTQMLDYQKDSQLIKIECLYQKPVIHDTKGYSIIMLRDVTQKEKLMAEMKDQHDQLAVLNKELEEHALCDIITDLPNRRYFQDVLRRSLVKAQRKNSRLAIFFIDLDLFKRVNDQYGHDYGDELLKQVGQRLQKNIRKSDFLARLGGDEFILLLEDIETLRTIVVIAEAIVAELKEPFQIKNRRMWIAASIGIALYPDAGRDAETIIKHADQAMYKAKTSGRGQYCFFTEKLNVETKRREKIEKDLEAAIKNNEFFLCFQKLIDSRTKKIWGMEALVRWQHPVLGVVLPEHFIGTAEESGIITQLDYWVFERACQYYDEWIRAKKITMPISVNVSTSELKQDNYAEFVLDTLEKNHLRPEQIVLEITETALINNLETAIPILTILHERGIKIAIDDFGTGYSSFHHLIALPISIIKIDLMFVNAITTNHKNYAICKSIIDLAKSLNFEVIAEGVESKEQLDILEELGCHLIQGFYFSKPTKADQIFSS